LTGGEHRTTLYQAGPAVPTGLIDGCQRRDPLIRMSKHADASISISSQCRQFCNQRGHQVVIGDWTLDT
jgi:hypothetical protein